jgi:hypothetical protein
VDELVHDAPQVLLDDMVLVPEIHDPIVPTMFPIYASSTTLTSQSTRLSIPFSLTPFRPLNPLPPPSPSPLAVSTASWAWTPSFGRSRRASARATRAPWGAAGPGAPPSQRACTWVRPCTRRDAPHLARSLSTPASSFSPALLLPPPPLNGTGIPSAISFLRRIIIRHAKDQTYEASRQHLLQLPAKHTTTLLVPWQNKDEER